MKDDKTIAGTHVPLGAVETSGPRQSHLVLITGVQLPSVVVHMTTRFGAGGGVTLDEPFVRSSLRGMMVAPPPDWSTGTGEHEDSASTRRVCSPVNPWRSKAPSRLQRRRADWQER